MQPRIPRYSRSQDRMGPLFSPHEWGRRGIDVSPERRASRSARGQAVTGRFHGMKTDCGVGLRLGIPRYNSALIRIDYAYALNSSPLNRPGRVISLATSQAF